MRDVSFGLRRWLIRAFGRLHAFAYEATGGRFGAELRGLPMLLLHHVGRTSGTPRTTPLLTMRSGEEYVVVASFYGSPGHPAWYRNLQARPDCEVRVGRRRFPARARTADAQERARLWPELVAFYPGYGEYQKRTDREIPVVVLSAAGPAAP